MPDPSGAQKWLRDYAERIEPGGPHDESSDAACVISAADELRDLHEAAKELERTLRESLLVLGGERQLSKTEQHSVRQADQALSSYLRVVNRS